MHNNDKELIRAIRSGGKIAEDALKFIVKKYKKEVWSILLKKKIMNPEDVFQESIIALFLNIQKGKFQQKSSLKTYLISICLNKGLNENKSFYKKRTIDFEALHEELVLYKTPESILLGKEKQKVFNQMMNSLGPKCKQILSLWAMGYKMREIAELTDYKNANSVKKKKCTCLKQLINQMKNIHTKNLINE